MNVTAAVITVSDKGSRGERVDTSGPMLCGLLKENGYDGVYMAIEPDEIERIKDELIHCADTKHVGLVLTTGGTGFAARDVTPEATLEVIEREARGIPEAMRAASMCVTPRGCLSRGVAGIRGGTLIVNLPGSEKAARENIEAVMDSLSHGMKMIASEGSAECASTAAQDDKPRHKKEKPSIDQWLHEAKSAPGAEQCGMYLFHNGIVRETARAKGRQHQSGTQPVKGMIFSSDEEKVKAAVAAANAMPGIHYARVWLNEGELSVGDDVMLVLVGGDIRPHVVDALQALVGEIKTNCVQEKEVF